MRGKAVLTFGVNATTYPAAAVRAAFESDQTVWSSGTLGVLACEGDFPRILLSLLRGQITFASGRGSQGSFCGWRLFQFAEILYWV
jgi:hypothetical protein